MSWSFDNTKPIYLQIMEKIKLQIVSHELEPNQQLPTVRDLARIWTSSFSPVNNFPRSSCNTSSLACFNLATKKKNCQMY